MHAKVIPKNRKHSLNSPVGNITKLEKSCWDRIGASCDADFNPMTNSAPMQLQGCLSRSANKIPIIKLLQMKELKALNQIQLGNK